MFAKKNSKKSDNVAVVDDEAENRKSTLLRRITTRKAKAEAKPDVKPKEIFIGDPTPPESDSDESDASSSEEEPEVHLDDVFPVAEEVVAIQKQVVAPQGDKKKTKNGSSQKKIGRPKKTDQEREDERIKDEKKSRLLEARRVRAANARAARNQANIDDFQARAREFVAAENRTIAERKRLEEDRINNLAEERARAMMPNKTPDVLMQPLTIETPQRPRRKFTYR